MFRSLRWRITIPYVTLVLATVLGLGLYLSVFVRNNHLEDLESTLVAQASLLSDTISRYYVEEGKLKPSINSLTDEWSDLLDARITIIDINGTVLVDSHQNPSIMDNHLKRPEVADAFTYGYGKRTRISSTLGFEMMYVALPIKENSETIGVVRIALPTEQINQKIIHLRSTILYASLLAALTTIALSAIIAYLIAQPLTKLTQSVSKWLDEDHTHTSSRMEYNEVQQLSNAFNILITDLRDQIKSLQIEQGRISSILKQMTDGVIITNEKGIVQLINPKAESLFDLDRDESEGLTLIQVLRNHKIVEAWQECKNTGQEQALSLELLRQHRFIQCIIILLVSELPGQFLLLFQDLTRMQRLETIRRDFISNISHELRTPLASLKAITETLQDGAIDDPPAAQRFLSRMETEVDALAQMVSELLELTRIESGQVPLELKSLSPIEIIDSAVDRLSLQAERVGVQILKDYQESLPDVTADPPRLGQAMVNLLHNAIKFTPMGGKVTLRAWQQKDVVVFAIEDTGVGIPADDLPRIFERFFKADRARSGGGTGLGLAITRHLVEAHGGKIWVESVEGQGSTFYFSIPI